MVAVDVGDAALPNDLVSRLVVMLSQYEEHSSTHDVIFEPSQVLTFRLKTLQDSLARPSDPFVFPRFFYLDQFLGRNLEFANEKRKLHRDMQEEINMLTKQKEYITRFNVCVHLFLDLQYFQRRAQNKDTLKDLRTSLHYYEHVADAREDEGRQDAINRTTMKLKDILSMMVEKLDGQCPCTTIACEVLNVIPRNRSEDRNTSSRTCKTI